MNWKSILRLLIFLFVIMVGVFVNQVLPPADFPVDGTYVVENGTGLTALADDLSDKKIIRSVFLFKAFAFLSGGSRGIVAGDYVLDQPENTLALAWRMTAGDYRLQPVRVTLPEGLNVYEMAEIISAKFPKITKEIFIERAKSLEGYLFPDTYVFQTNTGVYTVIETMQDNYKKKIATVSNQIRSFGQSESDIIKMASIVEEEGRTTDTRRIISGILWKRLSLGMPLQVDATFKYINGKTTKDLTLNDLKFDSPYNTYLYKGLPPTPICSPGLDSIKATLTPTMTEYLYFLTDKNGVMHYAKTHAEHLQNKEKYLR